MKKYQIRRKFIKLKLKEYSFKKCREILLEQFEVEFSIRTLKRWWKRFNEDGRWDLQDYSTRPKTIHYKFSENDREKVISLRKKTGYSAHQIRIKLQEKGIIMSDSFIKQIIKSVGLSRGNKMEGIKLKWVRFERDNPNSMWQIDGTELDDGSWLVPVIDDCSRYCIGITIMKHQTTDNITNFLDGLIAIHGKPREILTDNGSEFGGTSKDSQFDKWCKRRGIKHIRSGVHKPTTTGKVSAVQQTIMRELSYCNNDIQAWRIRYNHERPHQSLRGLTPATVYFQFKRHKKHYEL